MAVAQLGSEHKGYINWLMTHPDVYPTISDDGSPPVEEYEADLDSGFFLSTAPGNLFIFTPYCYRVYSMHSCILPEARGPGSVKAARECIKWMFEKGGAVKIVGVVCDSDPRAQKFALKIGFNQEGRYKKSFIRGGVLQDLIIYGQEAETCQQQR